MSSIEVELKSVREKWQTDHKAIQREGSHQLLQLVLKSGSVNNNHAYNLLRQKGFLNPNASVFEPCFEGVIYIRSSFKLIVYINYPHSPYCSSSPTFTREKMPSMIYSTQLLFYQYLLFY